MPDPGLQSRQADPVVRCKQAQVDVLYIADCPHHQAYLPCLRQLLSQAGVDAVVTTTQIDTFEQAQEKQFLGSPTVRVAGADVEPSAAERGDYGMSCRLYRHDGRVTGWPSDEWVLAAVAALVPPR